MRAAASIARQGRENSFATANELLLTESRPLRATVLIFEAVDVVLVEVTECYLEKDGTLGAATHAMFGPAWTEEHETFGRLVLRITDMNDARAFNHPPEFIAMLVSLQTDRLTGMHGDYFHGRFLVQREALEVSPGANFLFVVRKMFHSVSIQAFVERRRIFSYTEKVS